jgi:hypothetical protein
MRRSCWRSFEVRGSAATANVHPDTDMVVVVNIDGNGSLVGVVDARARQSAPAN